MLEHPRKAHQAAPVPSPVPKTAPQGQPGAPLAASEAPARTQAPPEPNGPQNAAERPENAIPHLVPLAVEALAMTAEQAARSAFAKPGDVAMVVAGSVLDYPVGTVLGFRPGKPARAHDVLLGRLSTGGLVVGRRSRCNRVEYLEVPPFDVYEIAPGPDGQALVAPCMWASVDVPNRSEARAAAGR